jgi:hypothetical protein
MAYKEITSLDADTTIALGGKNKKTGKNNPTRVEGFYLGSRKVESQKSKTGFAYIHYFQTSTGNVGVWGKTDMDRKLQSANVGQMTLVNFDKMKETKNGEMYVYKVQQDPDNAIEVSGNFGSNDEESSYGGGESSGDEDEQYVGDTEYSNGSYEEEQNDDDAVQAAALAAAERKAKVQAMLTKNKVNKGANTTKN